MITKENINLLMCFENSTNGFEFYDYIMTICNNKRIANYIVEKFFGEHKNSILSLWGRLDDIHQNIVIQAINLYGEKI